MPVRFPLIAFSALQESHGVLDLLDIPVKVGHPFVVALVAAVKSGWLNQQGIGKGEESDSGSEKGRAVR
jgi:hypothetical protein